MAKKWVLLKATRDGNIDPDAPAAGHISRITPNPQAPVHKRERQVQMRGDLERQVIAKRREQLATAEERLGHLTASGADVAKADLVFAQPDGSESPRTSSGAVRQWGDEDFEKSARAGVGLQQLLARQPA
jgi:hypothetical protein